MYITQAHIDFYRAKKVPASSLQRYVKKSFNVKWYRPTDTIDILINSQVKDTHKGTEPHNIISFIKGWRHSGGDILPELYRMATTPYATDPKRRTAYARKWHARLSKQRKGAMTHTTKHTPGPWKAVPDRSRNLYTWYVEGAKGVVPAIARLSLIDACEEIEGNAHLIAAAPAMYTSGQLSLEVMEHVARELERLGNEPLRSLLRSAIIEQKTALAQAEGKS